MTTYGDTLFPLDQGSQGNPASQTLVNKQSPGVILIIADTILLDKRSILTSGLSSKTEDVEKSSSKSSGGSISIFGRVITLLGKVLAEGESSFSILDGEGGGGRVYIHNICWMKILKNQIQSYYNFTLKSISAKAGERSWDIDDINQDKEYLKENIETIKWLTSAKNGSKNLQ